MAESGHSKRADSGSLNVRFGEKRTFGTKSVASAFWADRPDLGQAIHLDAGQSPVKLTEIHLDAVLVDEELADQVWQAWVAGRISDLVACHFWLATANLASVDDRVDPTTEAYGY